MNHLSLVKKVCIVVFLLIAVFSASLLPRLKFSFDFSQFFPEEDPDLEFYQAFVEEFGTDDNFLLIAIKHDATVFDEDFLKKFHAFSVESKDFDFVTESSSLTTLSYPLKTSFGFTQLPVIHRDDPLAYKKDWEKIKEDGLFVNFLIDSNASSTVVALRTQDDIDYQQAELLLSQVRASLKTHQLDNYHILGRAFFLEAIVDMQKSEVLKTSIIAAILVLIILLLVYRSIPLVFISMVSICLSLIIFMGILALWGKELNAMAAFYPVLMLIVGTSDVIHVTDSFIRKIQSGIPRYKAIRSSLREVGLTTLLTSVTTAVGFITLLSSRLVSIQEFGINAAIGVMVAYLTVIFFTGSLLISLPEKMLLGRRSISKKWVDQLLKINTFTKNYPKSILAGTLLFTGFCFWGISLISTNYEFKRTLPNNSEIAADFEFFQQNYAGFRPLEIAVMSQDTYKVLDHSVALEIEKLMGYLNTIASIGNLQSSNLPFKILHKAYNLNKSDFMTFPDDAATFEKYKKDINKLGRQQLNRFVNEDGSMARINGRLQDVGTDSLKVVYDRIEQYAKTDLDTTKIRVKVTGKSLLLDKNSEYIRSSLLEGLFLGLLLIGIIMVLVFRNFKIFIISLIPNILPILFAGAVLGFLSIPLEASLSVVFAIVFGIAVDDTIHFLGKYKLGRTQGLTQEEALQKTFAHTGRALVITTIILFFGFLVLLFSIHQPSITIGIIISVTLVTALILDVLLLPVLIRKMLREA